VSHDGGDNLRVERNATGPIMETVDPRREGVDLAMQWPERALRAKWASRMTSMVGVVQQEGAEKGSGQGKGARKCRLQHCRGPIEPWRRGRGAPELPLGV